MSGFIPQNAGALLPWIVMLPLVGALTNFVGGSLLRRSWPRQLVYFIANVSVLTSFVLGVIAFLSLREVMHTEPDAAFRYTGFQWISAGVFQVDVSFLFDQLSAVMVLVVTGVGFLVHLYSTGYMDEDPSLPRYFAYLNLFIFSMLVLVLGKNLALLFVGWEGVGACSYLLIGFWFDDMAKAQAGQKAFVVNRIGDFGFAIAIFMLLAYAQGTVDYDSLRWYFSDAAKVLDHGTTITAICLLLFLGAAGKSAQIPLYVWLPDAMAGPTPVSALIHAATMVTAGVYMVARLNFLYVLSPHAMAVVTVVGGATALFAAVIGVTQTDIKKVLAYSTVSQLGYMFVGVGSGAFAAGIFHLYTHAFFKACLFLGAGSVIYAMHHEQDILKMGGLARKLPITRMTFLLSCLAIAGIPPLAGFFSKDAILAETLAMKPKAEVVAHYYERSFAAQASVAAEAKTDGTPAIEDARRTELRAQYIESLKVVDTAHKVAFALALIAAFLTAFYMFRLYFLTFSGQTRADHHTYDHAHEPPWSMGLTLVVLAFFALTAGLLGTPFGDGKWNLFDHWLEPVFATGGTYLQREMTHTLEYGLMGLSFAIALAGIGLAWALYGAGLSDKAIGLHARFPGLHRLVTNKFFVDEFYERALIEPLRTGSKILFGVVDRLVIDIGLVRLPGYFLLGCGRLLRVLQDGDVQRYAAFVVLGVAALAYWLI